MVAGGLNASNVESAVDFLHPWCVDVSSGIEVSSEILRKDPQKLQEFIRNSQMH